MHVHFVLLQSRPPASNIKAHNVEVLHTAFCTSVHTANIMDKQGLVTNVTCPAFTDFSWEDQTYAFWGTVDYASVRNLSGYHPTPRDDLEGLACTLLEMATGMSDTMHKSTLNMHTLQVYQQLIYLVLNRWSTIPPLHLLRSQHQQLTSLRLVPGVADQPSFATPCR